MSRSFSALAFAALLPFAQAVAQPSLIVPPTPIPAVQQDRTVMLVVGGSIGWDSNPLRISKADNPVTLTGSSDPSDTIATATIGLSFDKSFSQQRFVGWLSETAYRYDKFKYLDFDGTDYRAAWLGQLGSRISTRLAIDQNQSLVNYADFQITNEQNVVTTRNQIFTVNGLLGAGWSVQAKALGYELKNSAAFAENPSNRSLGGEAGVRYDSSPGRWLALDVRAMRGDYVNQPINPVTFTDDGYVRTDTALTSGWSLTAKSSLGLRLGFVDYVSNTFSQRDFSGVAGHATFNWRPVTKLALDFTVRRDLNPWTADYASYRVDDTAAITLTWDPTAKIQVRAAYAYVDTDFLQPIPTYVGDLRRDFFHGLRLAADWKPLRNLTITLGGQREYRNSTFPTGQYDATGIRLSAALQI